jgi:hypothetical protein
MQVLKAVDPNTIGSVVLDEQPPRHKGHARRTLHNIDAQVRRSLLVSWLPNQFWKAKISGRSDWSDSVRWRPK